MTCPNSARRGCHTMNETAMTDRMSNVVDPTERTLAPEDQSLHVFVVWFNAKDTAERIETALRETFNLISSVSVRWSHDMFRENMSRLYGRKLPSIEQKVAHCGIGDFRLFLVEDENPDFQIADTTSGPQYVNLNVFEAKKLYRDWTDGGHRIHATNNNSETYRDLSLLIGRDPINILRNSDGEVLTRNLSGTNGWESFDELFAIMNACLPYVVLRNFAELHNGELLKGHGDVDVLVHSLEEARQIMNATPQFRQAYRRYHKITIGGRDIPFDIRNVGDKYYDLPWQVEILKNRIVEGQFYRPSETDLYFSLVYHALVHKKNTSSDYIQAFNDLRQNASAALAPWLVPDKLSDELDAFMNARRYRFTYPEDASVFYNLAFVRNSRCDADTSIKLWPILSLKVQARLFLFNAARRLSEYLPNSIAVFLKNVFRKRVSRKN